MSTEICPSYPEMEGNDRVVQDNTSSADSKKQADKAGGQDDE